MSNLPDELKLLSAAYSNQNIACNRVWLTSAIVLISIFSVEFDGRKANIIGISIVEEYFYIATFFISVVLNFSYCSMHSKIYEIGDIYRNLIDRFGLKKKFLAHSRIYKRSHSLSDFFHSIVTPNYNRVYPLRKTIDNMAETAYIPDTFYNFYKFLIDFFYSIIPFVAAISALIEIINDKYNPLFILFYMIVFVLYSALPTSIMLTAIWRWSFNR